MALPDLDVARVQRWCAARVPEHAQHQVRVECDVSAQFVTIVERRAPWDGEPDAAWTTFPLARLRWKSTTGTWSLLWRDRHLRFHEYDRVGPTAQVQALLDEVDRDPTAIFWG